MYYVVSFLVSAGAIFYIAQSPAIGGVTLEHGYTSALIFAVVLAIVNLLLGTLLRIVTFPLRLITLGAISFVISLIIVYTADQLVPTVTLTGWLPVVAIAVVTTLLSFFMKFFR